MQEDSPMSSRNILQQLANLPLQQLLMVESVAPTGKMLVDDYHQKLRQTRALSLPEGDALQRLYLDCMELSALYDFSTQLVNIPTLRELRQHEAAGDRGQSEKIDNRLLRDQGMFDARAEILNEMARAIRSYSGDYAKDRKSIARELRDNLENIFPGDFSEGIDLLVERTTELAASCTNSEQNYALDLMIQQFLVRQAIPRMQELAISMQLAMAHLEPTEIKNVPGRKGAANPKPGFRMDAQSVKAALADPDNANVCSLFGNAQKRG